MQGILKRKRSSKRNSNSEKFANSTISNNDAVTQPPVKVPPSICISIPSTKGGQRAINGVRCELNPSHLEGISSESDDGQCDQFSWMDKISTSDENNSVKSNKKRSISPVSTASSDTSDSSTSDDSNEFIELHEHYEDSSMFEPQKQTSKYGFWCRDDFKIDIVRTNLDLFEGAVPNFLYAIHVWENIPASKEVQDKVDDDLLSLHPGDGFRFELSKDQIKQPDSHTTITPRRTRESIDAFDHNKNKLDTNTSVLIENQYLHETPTQVRNNYPVSLTQEKSERDENIQLISSPSLSQTPNQSQINFNFTIPPPLLSNSLPARINSSTNLRRSYPTWSDPAPSKVSGWNWTPRYDPIGATPQNTQSAVYLPAICHFYKTCKKAGCHFNHHVTSQFFKNTSKATQNLFWDRIKTINSREKIDIFGDVFNSIPPALIETKNIELLKNMLTWLLSFQYILDKTPLVKGLIQAMEQIPNEKGELISFEEILVTILRDNHCFQDNLSHEQNLLCDILLSIAVESKHFIECWSVLEKIFSFMTTPVDIAVVEQIAEVCLEDTIAIDILKGVMNKLLLNDKLVKSTPAIEMYVGKICRLLAKMEGSMVSSQSAASHSSKSSPGQSILGKSLKEAFVACSNGEQLYHFFKEQCREGTWEEIVLCYVDLFGTTVSSTVVVVLLKQFTDSIILYLLDDEDEELLKLLMTIVINLLIVFRELEMKHYVECANLIAYFENYLDRFHDMPVLNETYKFTKHILIFSRLIHGRNYKLAFRWVSTDMFVPPHPDSPGPYSTKTGYEWFYQNVYQLMKSLHEGRQYELCKDLILTLLSKDYVKNEKWDMLDFINPFVKENLDRWYSNERNILIDARNCLFRLYKHIEQQNLRSVLIILYMRKTSGPEMNQLCLIFDHCQSYQQVEGHIVFISHLSTVEIQMVVHLFFYKLLRSNKAPYAVKVEYKELNGSVNLPRAIEPTVIDREWSLKNRVQYALKTFALNPISQFNGVFREEDVKFIMEKIRRSL